MTLWATLSDPTLPRWGRKPTWSTSASTERCTPALLMAGDETDVTAEWRRPEGLGRTCQLQGDNGHSHGPGGGHGGAAVGDLVDRDQSLATEGGLGHFRMSHRHGRWHRPDPLDPVGGRRSQDGADVVGILDAVEDQTKGLIAAAPPFPMEPFEIGGGQGRVRVDHGATSFTGSRALTSSSR